MLNEQPTADGQLEAAPYRDLLITEIRLLPMQSGNIVDVSLRVAEAIERGFATLFPDDELPIPRPLYRLDYAIGRMDIFPQVARLSQRLYGQKYEQIKEIQLDFDVSIPPPIDSESCVAILENLPAGFIKGPEFGLGLTLEMRPVILAIEKIKGITKIRIDQGNTRLDADGFYFNEVEFADLRIGMNRITRRYQRESLTDRELLAHNSSLHKVQPNEHPFKERPYEPGTIYKVLGGARASETKLIGKDRIGVLTAIANNASDIIKRDPKEFVQLQKDIELVSLDQLIMHFEQKLKRNSQESEWQKLLELNPFILSILFGQPVVLLRSSASVGGQTLSGGGTKIADFLMKNSISHNAAIVELKRPDTPLFGREYRPNVFSPSQPLMGSVVQILDQRHQLVTNVATITRANKLRELEVFAVECVIVAGRTPTTDARLTSFELMRNQMKDVRIITFDELLERLQLLRELLAGERYVSDTTNADDEGCTEAPHEDFSDGVDDEDRYPGD